MNFAYIDPASLLSEILRPQPAETLVSVPYDLDERWSAFEQTLGDFKMELAKNQVALVRNLAILSEKQEEIGILKMMLDNVSSSSLKDTLENLVDKFESDEGISALTQQCGEIKGMVDAQKKVLSETNAERYAKFTCFVCMDRLIDLYFDPCGHVICEPCWSRTQNKRDCPGCRTRLVGVRKIFSMC
jgi:hypothetical protein